MWVVAALASLVFLIILVLCIPVDMSFHLEAYGKPKFKMKMVWLFGLVNKELGRKKKESDGEENTTESRPKRTKRTIKAKTILQIMKTKGFLRSLVNLLKNIFSHLRIKDFSANFRVGLDDPADTGILFATIGAATSVLSSLGYHQIRVEPSFEDEVVFEGDLCGTIRLSPIQLAPPFIRFVFSLSTIRVLKLLFLTKWKRKK